jgi:hypothetical protein
MSIALAAAKVCAMVGRVTPGRILKRLQPGLDHLHFGTLMPLRVGAFIPLVTPATPGFQQR